MNEDNELRSIFQEKFSSETHSTPVSAWREIDSTLIEMRSKRRKKLIYFWLLSSSILIISGLTTFFIFKSEDIHAPISNQSPISKNNTSTSRNSLLKESPESVIDPNLNLAAGNYLKQNLIDTATLKTVESIDKGQKESARQFKHETKAVTKSDDKIEDINDKKTRIKPKENKKVSDRPLSSKQSKGLLKEHQQSNINKATRLNTNIDQNKTLSEEDFEDNRTLVESDSSEVGVSYINYLPIATPNILKQDVGKLPAITIEQLPKKSTEWMLSINYSIGRQVRRTDATTEEVNDLSFTANSPTRQIFNNFGARLHYPLTPHFSMAFGLETTVWKYRTRDYKKLVPTSTSYDLDSPVGRIPVNKNDLKEFYPTGETGDSTLLNFRMFQRLRYISVPAHIQYYFGSKSLQPYLRLGISGNFLVLQRTALFAEQDNLEREVTYNNIDGFRKVYLNLQPAIGMKWQINPKIGLFWEGVFNFPITKLYDAPSADYQNIKLQGRGANFGILFKI